MNLLARARQVMDAPELTQEEVDLFLEQGFLNLLTVRILAADLADYIDDEIFKHLTKEKTSS